MGTTPNGLPYPEPTAAVAGGADAIKALAVATRITSGIVTVPTGVTAGNVVVAVTFPAGLFTVTPMVVASPSASTSFAGPSGITTTGCSIAVSARSATGDLIVHPAGVNCRWVAVQL